MNVRSPNSAEPEHLLLAMAKSYPVPSADLAPQNCEYDLIEGAWVLQDAGSLLVETAERPTPITKKADLETGEDQKGS